MARRCLVPEAFDAYVAGGPGRTLSAVAKRFGVPVDLVRRTAARERWEARASALDGWARGQVGGAPGSAGEIAERHRKILHAVQGKALEALRATALRDGSAAVQALQLALSQERRLLTLLEEGRLDEIDVAAQREYDAWAAGGP